MTQIHYAFRDDEKTISLLVQGNTAACHSCQIITLRKREIAPEFLEQFAALDIKKNPYPTSALTDLGRDTVVDETYRYCLVRIHSQIEFTVKPRLMQRLAEFLPAYNANGLYNFFEGRPYGYIVVLQVFKSTTKIPNNLMEKGRMGAAQIIQLYDKCKKAYFDVPEPIIPLIDEGIFEYINDEIIHVLRIENALVGIYGNDENSKQLLRQKRDAHNNSVGRFKRTYNEDECKDRSIKDYDKIYRRIVKLDQSLTEFVAYVKTIKAPQMLEWQTLLPKAASGNEAARTRLIEMYTRNVFRFALYYSDKYRLPIADTIQDGLVGLITSIDKFDQAEATAYPTYFPLWVRQSIQREMPRYMYAKYFPVHIHEKLMYIRQMAEKLGITIPLGHMEHAILKRHICEKLLLTPERAERLLSYFRTPDSINEIIPNINEFVEAYPCLVITDTEHKIITKKVILDYMTTLSPKQKEVLMLRYGINGDIPKTLEEIGNLFGLTRERIRQIERTAIMKLRFLIQHSKLIDYS